LREGERHAAYFAAAIPTLEDGAAENDSRKERREHQRKCIRGAAELRREQASPADFISHSRGADDAKTNAEKSGSGMGGWSCNVIPRKHNLLPASVPGSWRESLSASRPGEQIERDGKRRVFAATQALAKNKEARDKRSHNRARCVDPVEPREARSEFG